MKKLTLISLLIFGHEGNFVLPASENVVNLFSFLKEEQQNENCLCDLKSILLVTAKICFRNYVF